MKLIDLCADLGEGFAEDLELMPLLTSANVCCAQHAGSVELTSTTLEEAQRHRLVIGAHPGYPDRANFGRSSFNFNDNGVASLTYQLGGIVGLAELYEAEVAYLKLHGAWYHQAMTDRECAQLVVNIAVQFDLALVGLPNSMLEEEANAAEWSFIREGYLDRRQLADGTLVPRHQPDAFLDSPVEAVDQVEHLVNSLQTQMFCIHGDRPGAVVHLKAVRELLTQAGYQFTPSVVDE